MKNFTDLYWRILKEDFLNLNLVGFRDKEVFHRQQVLDSLLPLEKCSKFKEYIDENKRVVDLGTGGGFPLLPLAYKCKDVSFLGVDSSKKKILAVAEIASKMDLSNVLTLSERIENIFFDKKCLITIKAVGECENVLSRIVAVEGVRICFYKGPQFYEKEGVKIESFEKDWLVESTSLDFEGSNGRKFIYFTKKTVPRGTKKCLVNLSDIL